MEGGKVMKKKKQKPESHVFYLCTVCHTPHVVPDYLLPHIVDGSVSGKHCGECGYETTFTTPFKEHINEYLQEIQREEIEWI
jgi:hypothetical protein